MDIDGPLLVVQCARCVFHATLGVSPDSSLSVSLSRPRAAAPRAPAGRAAVQRLANDFGLASPPLSRARKSASEAERGVLSLTQG